MVSRLSSGSGIHSEFLCEEPQLIGAQLLAADTGFGRQQLPQQPLRFVQLRRYIHEHLLQNVGILRQAVPVDWHLCAL